MNLAAEMGLPLTALNIDSSNETSIDFHVQHQSQDNWCWAAVGTSISKHYSDDSPWTQCKLACKVLNNSSCCINGSAASCDRTRDVAEVLAVTKNLAGAEDSAATTIERLEQSLQLNRPIAIRIVFASGRGHCVAIVGVRRSPDGTISVRISDPSSGDGVVTLDDLMGAYQGSGLWTDTYWTKS